MVIQRRDGRGRMVLTERDTAILRSIGMIGWLCPLALEWIHFGERVERWAAHLEARTGNPKLHYLVSRALYRRLRIFESAGLVQRYTCIGIHDGEAGGRDPDSYVLTEWGAELVQDVLDDGSVLKGYRQRGRSVFMVERYRELGLIYGAWMGALRRIEAEITRWEVGKYRVEDPDTVTLLRDQRDGTRKHVQIPIQPHAIFGVLSADGRRTRAFVEWDASSIDRENWRERLRAYEVYFGSKAARERYGDETLMLQIYVPDAKLQRKMIQLIGAVMPTYHRHVLVQLQERIHPLLIGTGWHVATIEGHEVTTTRGHAERTPIVGMKETKLVG